MKNNFILRTVTGVLFVAVLVACILYNALSMGVLFLLITTLAVREFCLLANRIDGVRVNTTVLSLGGAYLFFAFWISALLGRVEVTIFLPYIFFFLYMLISELYMKRQSPMLNWAFSALSQIYVALPFAMFNLLAFYDGAVPGAENMVTYNSILPLSVFVFIWLSDTGAYCVGSLFGKHRLFERISPKKSWEGSVGGAVLSMLSALVFAHFFPTLMTIWQWVGLAFVIVVFGTWGDLTESLLKRQLKIKDSGNILPGHGGMLDRFDSFIMAIPSAVFYIYALNQF